MRKYSKQIFAVFYV